MLKIRPSSPVGDAPIAGAIGANPSDRNTGLN